MIYYQKQLFRGIAAALLFGTALMPSTATAVPVYSWIGCKEWIATQQSDPKGVRKNFHFLALGTVNGIACGMGTDLWSKPTLAKPEDLYDWVDSYCASFPDEKVHAAIGAWTYERVGLK